MEATVLAIETAFPQISLALWASEKLLLPKTDLTTKRAASLHEALQELLETAGIRAQDLKHILIDQGPGSYTGLRVGLALAQTLEFTVGCEVKALYSTDLFATHFAEQVEPGETFAIALDARRRHWTLALYRVEDSGLKRLAEPRCLPLKEFEAALSDISQVAGPHSEVPGVSSPTLLPTPQAPELLDAFSLSRPVTRVQPIYLMPPV